MVLPISAKCFTNLGEKSWYIPNMSWYTRICPSHSTPAPIPMVGIESFSVTIAANFAGTHSSTIAKAPASCKDCASSIKSLAAFSVLPCTLWPPKAFTDCGVIPKWPQTGIPEKTILFTVAATALPPSSFTALALPSFKRRPALIKACSAFTW